MKAFRLLPLTVNDFELVAHVAVAPEHLRFSGSVAEAFATAETGVDFHGIFLGATAVGFFKVDRNYSTHYPFAPAQDLGLRAFMVDVNHQGKGIATHAVRALPAYLAEHYPQATAIFLTVNKINPSAIRAYTKGGFEDTGAQWPHGEAGPQHIMRLAI